MRLYYSRVSLPIIVISFFLYLFLVPVEVSAENNSFITVVNPVRLMEDTKNIQESINAQYSYIKKNQLPATWLLTYDILLSKEAMSVIKDMDNQQELGIFFEVTPALTNSLSIPYPETDSWHRSHAIFLTGYMQKQRMLMIDELFDTFKNKVGFYPKSVGAWWIDGYSLKYMKEKYGVTAYLNVSDQYETDGYHIWGQYWSVPYYPSNQHAAIPANNLSNKLDVVITQWAARDPFNGYGRSKSSMYSTQDYFVLGLPDSYFEKIVGLYTSVSNNAFGHIVLGLEGGLPANFYQGPFSRHIAIAQNLQKNQGIQVVTMQQFAQWYREKFPQLSPVHLIETDDLLGTGTKVFWYQSPNYRLFMTYDNNILSIKDLRTYHSDFQEPFYISPNKQYDQYIINSYIIDSVDQPGTEWSIPVGSLISKQDENGELVLAFENSKIAFFKDKLVLTGNSSSLPNFISNSDLISVKSFENGVELIPQKKWLIDDQGFLFTDIRPKIPYAVRHRLERYSALIIGILTISVISMIIRRKVIQTWMKKISKRTYIVIISILMAVIIPYPIYQSLHPYYVSQAEIDALTVLSNYPSGNVLVYDKDCLKCTWSTLYQPAVFANRRDYVQKFSRKNIVYSLGLLEAINHEQARDSLKKIDYIYLAKHEDYIETLPFRPEEIQLNRIYENANAQIWQVKR